MKLTEMTIPAFAELLGSDAPVPGGGSAAALSGTFGVALTTMAAALTIGKEKYRAHDALMQEIMEEGAKLRVQLTEAIDRDAEAFRAVAAIFAMPKATEADKMQRQADMQETLKTCTVTPYEMMECALSALELTERALGYSNVNVLDNLGIAALALKTALQGAWLNIRMNISSIRDEEFVLEYRAAGEAILKKALPLADKIYETVLSEL